MRKKIADNNEAKDDKGLRKAFACDIMYNDIARRIESNELKEGDAISSENTLISTYGISLSSIRLATKKLVDNGYLVTMPKIGKYARNPNLHRFKRILLVLHKEMFGHYSSIEWFTMQYLLGAMNFASKNKWFVQLVVSSVKKSELGNTFTEDIDLLGVDGVILHNFSGDHEMQIYDPYGKKLPVVNSGTVYPVEGQHNANIDFSDAAAIATEYLIGKGHREIAYFGESNNSHFMRLRAGFEKAMKAQAIAIKPQYILEVESYKKPDYYYAETKKILEQLRHQKLPTAIVFGSDRYLRIALDAAKNMGLKVPADFSVMSVENSFEIQETEPKITTVDTSFYNMGLLAAQLLNKVMFEPQTAGPFDEKVPLQVIEKESVKTLQS
jgi:GntR family transcriptional regulator, arabinose operon transcriptional repressor